MSDLLAHLRNLVSPILIDEQAWQDILECAHSLPISFGAQPFGFELPLHTSLPKADFGATLESETEAARIIQQRAKTDPTDEVASALTRLFRQMDAKNSKLRDVVGHKLMLEYDVSKTNSGATSFPGLFIRPDRRPIMSSDDRINDVRMVAESLATAVGWQIGDSQFETLKQMYLTQPAGIRMDSFGLFPARSRAIRLAIVGFQSSPDIRTYLENTAWPGCISTVESIYDHYKERMHIDRTGIHIDAEQNGLGPILGLTLFVKSRYTNSRRYWLDNPSDWDPFLHALSDEQLIVPEKLHELARWVVKPSPLLGRSGRYLLLRGIHHIKLVISDGNLTGAKAYVFFVLLAM